MEQAVMTEAPAKKWKGVQLLSLCAIFLGILVAFGSTLVQREAFAGFLILGGLIGLLAGTRAFIYLVAVYWGIVLGFVIFLIP
jgi:hypothetical protein